MVFYSDWLHGIASIETLIKVKKSLNEDGEVHSIRCQIGQLGFLTRFVMYDKREKRVFYKEIYPGSSDISMGWLSDEPIAWLDFLRHGTFTT